jgi:hypothetical protein
MYLGLGCAVFETKTNKKKRGGNVIFCNLNLFPKHYVHDCIFGIIDAAQVSKVNSPQHNKQTLEKY